MWTRFKGKCKVDDNWRKGYPVCMPSGWVGVKIYNSEKGCYDVYEVYTDTWKECE